MTEPLVRVVRRKAKAGCEEAYEALIRAMFADASRFPGYLAARVLGITRPQLQYRLKRNTP